MISNAALTREFLDEITTLQGDEASRRSARKHMENSTAIYHGRVVDSCFVPRFYNIETYNRFKYIAETTHRILEKVMREYLENPNYRHVYNLDPRLIDLILLPRDFDALLPFSRVDIFLNEDTMEGTFCEFNADGSSGMNENREITDSIWNSKAFQAFAAKHNVHTCNEDLFPGWVKEFLDIYATYTFKKENPHVAIIDFLENAITEEFKIFAKLFAEFGIECSVYDVRDLSFDGKHLIGGKAFYGRDNAVIDAAWRRSVTNDIMEHWDESQPLIEAVRNRKVALIGSFAGHLVHDKQIFQVLFKPETKALLTDEENTFIAETVPFTCMLDQREIDLDEVKAHREQWIIKPTDAYGSKDVYAGKDFDETEWHSIIDAFANEAAGCPFIVQHYCTPFQTLTLPLYGEESDYTRQDALSYNNLSGLYIYNGRFTGVFSRLGPEPIICKKTRGVTAATIWVND